MFARVRECPPVPFCPERLIEPGLDRPYDIDVTSGMSILEEVTASLVGYPLMLTIEEASQVLRIGRSLAYELAHRYEASDGRDGLPVMRLGSCMRVPRWALAELMSSGRVVRLSEAAAE